MIECYQENGLFILHGKNYSYAIYINEYGSPQTAYFGKRVDSDVECLVKNARKNNFTEKSVNFEHQYASVSREITEYGRLDHHEPTVILKRKDGAKMSRFSFEGYEIFKGSPNVDGMPHARYGGETLKIRLKDDFSDAVLYLNYTVFDDVDAIVRNIEIVNDGEEDFYIDRAFSYCFELDDCDYKVIKLHGDWSWENNVETSDIAHCVTKLQSLHGRSSHNLNPFMGIKKIGATETCGECIGINLIYSGNFSLIAEIGSSDKLRLQGGINETEFTYKLKKGVKFSTPQAVIVYSTEGVGGMSRQFTDFYRKHIIDKKWVDFERPIVVNHWEATEFSYTAERLFPIIDEAKKLGFDTFVLDDGWFGKRYDDKAGLGDWVVNEEKLQGGIKAIIDRCKKNGLKFGIWFEPEMVNEDSELFRKHPEYALAKNGVEPARARNQLVLDFSKKQVVDCIFAQMTAILDKYDISYVKWDMNRDLSELYSDGLPADRQGEVLHRYMLGVYNLAERLTTRYPDILFEGCSSGGGRFDGGMLYYFPQIWTSDDTDAYERSKIQYGTSYCYPLSSISCHVSACPNCHTKRILPLKTRFAVASLGTFGYELDITKLTGDEKFEVKQQIKEYKKISSLIRNGDLYRLKNPFEENFFAMQVAAKDKTSAYVSVVRTRYMRGRHVYNLKLEGLDEDSLYYIKELSFKATGRMLKNLGVVLPDLCEYESLFLHIEKVLF